MNESEIRNRVKEIVRETLVEENEYQKFFQAVLAKHGGSIKKMGTQEKRDFFNKIDSAWQSRGEKRGTEKVEVFEDLNEAKVVGKNNKTGERFGVVIGSDKQTDEGYEITIRKSYSSRVGEIKWTFDENGLPNGMVDQGYTLDGKPSGRGGFGKSFKGKDGVKGLSLEYTPAFAKRVIEYVKSQKKNENVNEATDMGPYEKDNKEIIKFFVGNSKELDKYPKTLYRHTKYKDTKSLIRDLIKASHKPYTQIKVGMEDKEKRIMSFNYKKRSDMEKLLKSGNLGDIEIQIVDQARMQRAIDKFGTSA